MAAALAGALPGIIDANKDNPFGLQGLLKMGGYELYGKQLEEQRFQNQLKLARTQGENSNFQQQNTFDFQRSQARDAYGHQTAMQNGQFLKDVQLQTNQFNHQNSMQNSGFDHAKEMQSGQIKGQLMNTALQGGLGAFNQGVGMIGNFLNYKYNSNLQQQAFENQTKLFNNNVQTMSETFRNDGLPASAAFLGSNFAQHLPHSSQVLSGINTRTAKLPGRQTQFYAQTDSQTALGLGVVNVG